MPEASEELTASAFNVCVHQTATLLSVRWWVLTVGGGYPEVQAVRLVFNETSLSVVAKANGCHLPTDNDLLAKAMLGHVCFDATIQVAARMLKQEWALCGGYALSCVTRSTSPHAKYQYVKQLFSAEEGKVTEVMWATPHGNCVDKSFYWGDVDFFLRNSMLDDHLDAGGTGVPASQARLQAGHGPFDWEWTSRKTRRAMRHAKKTLTQCLSTVAGYNSLSEMFSDTGRRLGYSSKLSNFSIGPGLLGRTQTIQFIMERSPKPDAVEIVLGFDMTQCAVWFEDISLEQGEPFLTLGMPCEKWKNAIMERKGFMTKRNPHMAMSSATSRKRRARRRKYRERGFMIKMRTFRQLRKMLVPHVTLRMKISLS